MKKKTIKTIKTIISILFLLIVYFGINGTGNDQKNIPQDIIPAAEGSAATTEETTGDTITLGENVQEGFLVLRVVDGDTIVIRINDVDEKVRLIGIDTPESVHPNSEKNIPYGKTASDFTKKRLEGKIVGIEMDAQERDQYGRLLAYVYLDGVMFNKTLLEEGHAKVTTYPPNVKYVEDFTQLQEIARKEGKGLWAL